MSFLEPEKLGSVINPEVFFYGDNIQDKAGPAAQIEALSGVFSDEPESCYRVSGHIVTNDRQIDRVVPIIQEGFKEVSSDGIGLFVGTGAHLSLLPDLDIRFPVVTDINLAVLECSALLGKLIVEYRDDLESLPDDRAVINYASTALSDVYADLSRNGPLRFTPAYFRNRLDYEAKHIGDSHWSNPDRVGPVAEALQEKTPVYVLADVTNEEFIGHMATLLKTHDLPITFANFTNVHEWVNAKNMLHIEALPWDQSAIILYSDISAQPTSLVSTPVKSIEAYVQMVRQR